MPVNKQNEPPTTEQSIEQYEIGLEIIKELNKGTPIYRNADGSYAFEGKQKTGARIVPHVKEY